MAHRTPKKEITNASVKKEKDRIIQSIQNDKVEKKDLESLLVFFNKETKNKEGAIISLNKEIKDIDKTLNNKRESFRKLEAKIQESDLKLQNSIISNNKEVEAGKKKTKEELLKLNGEIKKAEKELSLIKDSVNEVNREKVNVENNVKLKTKRLFVLNARLETLEKKQEEIRKLNDKIKSLDSLVADKKVIYSEIYEAKELKKDFQKDLILIKVNINKSKDKLSGIDEEVKNRLSAVTKRELSSEVKLKDLAVKERDLAQERKSVETIKNTLRKHLKRQNINIKI